MTVSVTHPFQSAKSDGTDNTLVQPSNWNSAHTITCAGNSVIGNSTGANGAVSEIPLGTMGASILAANAIADLIAAGLSLASTGDIKLTLKTAADTGWLMCNDQTIGNTASGATYANSAAQALYTLLWNNVSNTYAPVTGGRGVSAAADWAAQKPLQLTLMMGRTLAVAGTGAPVASAATNAATTTASTVSAATNAITALGSNVLYFGSVPTNALPGVQVSDTTTGGVIPPGTVVLSVGVGYVELSNNVVGAGVGSGDTIVFNTSNVLNFASVPAGVGTGQSIADTTNSGSIPAGAYAVYVGTTAIVMSQSVAATVNNGDTIVFDPLSARSLGQNAGQEKHGLQQSELPAHTHPQQGTISLDQPDIVKTNGSGFIQTNTSTSGSWYASNNPSQITPTVTLDGGTGPSGGGVSHNVMQPTTFLNAMIKL